MKKSIKLAKLAYALFLSMCVAGSSIILTLVNTAILDLYKDLGYIEFPWLTETMDNSVWLAPVVITLIVLPFIAYFIYSAIKSGATKRAVMDLAILSISLPVVFLVFCLGAFYYVLQLENLEDLV